MLFCPFRQPTGHAAGTLADPAVGVTLAVAIAIHNIPEGLCVALPIYYATGNPKAPQPSDNVFVKAGECVRQF